jgi:hypothetical protein
MVGSNVIALFTCYSGLAPQGLLFNELGFHRYYKENSLRKLLWNFERDPTVGSKLWPFSAFIPVWRDMTSSSTSRDSIGTTRKMASRNYCKTLSAIQRSDQMLSPFSPVIPAWLHKASSSTNWDSIDTTRKTAETSVKLWARSNGRIKCYRPFQLLFRFVSTRPPLQRIGIP